MELITVFTPTYNRKELLSRVYDSLMNQTSKNFIWMIIDDGSTDNTASEVKKYISKADFNIKYFYQNNSGKQKARNNAVKRCKTKYFVTLDSDDSFDCNAIKKMEERVKEIDNNDLLCGIIAPKFRLDTKKPSYNYMPSIKFANSIELYEKYGYKGETVILFKTSILKEYPNIEIPNEKFISEIVSYNEIAKKYKLLVTNDVIYYFEYQEDGYSSDIMRHFNNSPIGYAIMLESVATSTSIISKKLKYYIKYLVWCIVKKIPPKKYLNNKFVVLLLPIGYLLCFFKKPNCFFKKIGGNNEKK